MNRRKVTSISYRLGGCEICGFPLTHRHHILGFKKYGEDLNTWQLCPNCHELLHIAISAIVFKHKRAVKVWEEFSSIQRYSWLVEEIEDRVYQTAEFVVDTEIKYF